MSEQIRTFGKVLNSIKQIENELLTEKQKVVNKTENNVCVWCDRVFEAEETYYFCIIHKKAFCYDCARNYGKKELSYYEAPSCTLKNPFPIIMTGREVLDDCIMEKKIK